MNNIGNSTMAADHPFRSVYIANNASTTGFDRLPTPTSSIIGSPKPVKHSTQSWLHTLSPEVIRRHTAPVTPLRPKHIEYLNEEDEWNAPALVKPLIISPKSSALSLPRSFGSTRSTSSNRHAACYGYGVDESYDADGSDGESSGSSYSVDSGSEYSFHKEWEDSVVSETPSEAQVYAQTHRSQAAVVTPVATPMETAKVLPATPVSFHDSVPTCTFFPRKAKTKAPKVPKSPEHVQLETAVMVSELKRAGFL